MANKMYDENAIQDIAVAIREKNGSTNTYNVGEMGSAIRAIEAGSSTPTETITITENGTYDVISYASAMVNVSTGSDSDSNLGVNFNTGVISLSEDMTPIVNAYNSNPFRIEHGLASTPSAFVMCVEDYNDMQLANVILYASYEPFRKMLSRSTNTSGGVSTAGEDTAITVDETYVNINPPGSGYTISATYTYRWFAWCTDTPSTPPSGDINQTTAIINGVTYDISASEGYNYKMIMNLNGSYYLYYSDAPMYVNGADDTYAYSEIFKVDHCYRSNLTDTTFDEGSTYNIGVTFTDESGYRYCNKARTLDAYVWANHDLKYWGTETVAVPSSVTYNGSGI